MKAECLICGGAGNRTGSASGKLWHESRVRELSHPFLLKPRPAGMPFPPAAFLALAAHEEAVYRAKVGAGPANDIYRAREIARDLGVQDEVLKHSARRGRARAERRRMADLDTMAQLESTGALR